MICLDEIAQAVLGILSVQSVYALVLFPLIWGLVKCCRGRYSRWQHGLWLLILLRLVLPPDMAAPWSAGHLIRSLTPYLVSRPLIKSPQAPLILPYNQKTLDASLPDAPSISDGQNAPGKVTTIGNRPETIWSSHIWEWLCLIVCSAWLAAVSLLLALFFRKRLWFWKIAGKGRTVLDPALLIVVRTWRRRLHIQRTIGVKTVASNVPPFTIGLFRPVVVLPEQLIFPVKSAAFEPVLAHELVHVKRWDDLAVCLQELVRIVYFFHPLVWFVMPRLTWTREAVCDAAVLSHGSFSPRTYGRLMLALVQRQNVPKMPFQGLAEFTNTARGIAFRLNYIQKEDNMRHHPVKMYLAILFLGLFLLPMAPVVSSDEGKITEGISEPASYANNNDLPSESPNDDALDGIINPFDSTCYDWRGEIIPCKFKRQYAELLIDKPIPDTRFIDNKDGTVTDNLTKLVWLKNANFFGMLDWKSAAIAVKGLKEGDRGLDSDFILSDSSSAGDWRLPTMKELCALIDFSRRDPALPNGHMFSNVPPGYHWSVTTLDYYSEIAWIVYFESGTTCYHDIKSRAGHIWPVRKPKI